MEGSKRTQDWTARRCSFERFAFQMFGDRQGNGFRAREVSAGAVADGRFRVVSGVDMARREDADGGLLFLEGRCSDVEACVLILAEVWIWWLFGVTQGLDVL